jgi:hypothetical protein
VLFLLDWAAGLVLEKEIKMDLNWLATHIPFMALVANDPPENRPMLTRLIEQGVVGIVAAAIGIYANDIRQQGQIESLNTRVAEVQQAQKESMVVLSLKIDEMRRDLYVPRNRK